MVWLDKAAEGWRLVEIFAPGLGVHGVAAYFELIFERPVAEADQRPTESITAGSKRR